ncbi:hypothetical protein POTOM_005897 [Populus tomentosa]|uniref:Uncharacterized protein n=1 Tax=Populus tomentosa TaxID=118781 RepID=A0A8X8AI40_POPTO|nr:hypothetical protein POTOM_005897 [Populus tomentosa]
MSVRVHVYRYMRDFFPLATECYCLQFGKVSPSCAFVFFRDHRYAGEVRLIMHYANANKAAAGCAPSAPLYGAPVPQVSYYSAPPPAHGAPYGQPSTAYTGSSPYPSYPPSSAYPPSTYPPPPAATYPPAPPVSWNLSSTTVLK